MEHDTRATYGLDVYLGEDDVIRVTYQDGGYRAVLRGGGSITVGPAALRKFVHARAEHEQGQGVGALLGGGRG